MKNLKLISLASLLCVGIISCKGPTGPEGPQGNANVLSSALPVNSGDWIWDGTNFEYFVGASIPDITSDIASNGLVEVFLETNSAPTFTALPYTYYLTTTLSEAYTYSFSTGHLELDVTYSDLLEDGNPPGGTFKIVAIAASAIKDAHNKGIDLTNYKEVLAYSIKSPNQVSITQGCINRGKIGMH